MKKSKIVLFLALGLSMGLTSCYESMEDRAERECKEYTEKNCPTPERDNTILDSLAFDRATRTMNHYYTLTGPADDTAQFVGNHAQLHEALLTDLKNRTEMKIYMDEDFNFGFIYRSQKDKQLVLFHDTLKPGEYK